MEAIPDVPGQFEAYGRGQQPPSKKGKAPMGHVKRFGRIGGLTVGLGIGAVVATPGIAAADPVLPVDLSDLNTPAIVDGAAAAVPAFSAPGFDFDPNDFALSISGIVVFQRGSATATSGFGALAVADGTDSSATATGGLFDNASATGADSSATANGLFADAGATGAGSSATTTGGLFDNAIVNGTDSSATTTGGLFDNAIVNGTDSSATSTDGLLNNAFVFADNGAAAAGPGNLNLAAVLSSGLNATATGTGVVDIVPSSVDASSMMDPGGAAAAGDASGASTSSDDLLSAAVTDFTDAKTVLASIDVSDAPNELQSSLSGYISDQTAMLNTVLQTLNDSVGPAESTVLTDSGPLSTLIDQWFFDPLNQDWTADSKVLLTADQGLDTAVASGLKPDITSALQVVDPAESHVLLTEFESIPLIVLGDLIGKGSADAAAGATPDLFDLPFALFGL
jgi:hypothetical protein